MFIIDWIRCSFRAKFGSDPSLYVSPYPDFVLCLACHLSSRKMLDLIGLNWLNGGDRG